MNRIPHARRIALAFVSLTCAAFLFRGNVAAALVTRGDDLLRAGDVDGAVKRYARAERFDAASAVAADRLAFFLLVRRGRGDAMRAYTVADRALRIVPEDPALLVDRAFAAQRLARWRASERDFLRAARIGRDPRYAHLAARSAAHRGDRRAAREDLRTALAIDGAYAPAKALLRRSGA